ncbi:MAG: NfeD family protein [Armatimonadetes bacterium]|nr:NfeD family protein [Akkermansiaceae bacterium]
MSEIITNWWDALDFELQVFYGIAIVASICLLIQLFLSLFMGMDHDFDSVGVHEHSSGMSIFSIRGVTAFFLGFGWTGAISIKSGLGLLPSIFLALMVGTALMFVIYVLMKSFLRLQSSGTLDYANAVGQLATVYVTIPPTQGSGGQIETMIQGRLVTAEALQKSSEPLKPGTKVMVVEKIGSSTLIVETLKQ